MKLLAYNVRTDESMFFQRFSEKYGVELHTVPYSPSLENAEHVQGFDAVSIVTSSITKEILKKWKAGGIRCVSTRTAGYDHIDMEAAKTLGIPVSTVNYTPASVAEYTVMLILMTLRKVKTIVTRGLVQDFSLTKVRGRELRTCTVGIIGAGRIGEAVIQRLRGFGCKILVHTLNPKEELASFVSYVSLEALLRESDVISLHAPARAETEHLIGQKEMEQMKEGAVLINAARGTLIDTQSLIAGLESGKIGAAALDVLENERKIFYKDLKYKVIPNRDLAVLQSMPNVIITPHTAFYTEEAVSDMVEYSILSCKYEAEGKDNPWRVE
ncbi:D-isomer specific 2-hydroxyacid dehydrogenase family protein [Clostridium sp. HBUAS56010]|uniref:D-isomer specific 2-hydroxyacid dehydrogenase family protein n=1 Tax=Clostridium sp. HBUAS56010 TaxID=2571127 RepID=UPI001178BAEF|nr:D-isomer specific 2-hydroxyacid dehydrogenase family protein [Clostridium sp. HBUAS56010]